MTSMRPVAEEPVKALQSNEPSTRRLSGQAVKSSASWGMVPSLRLRTRFLLSMLVITAGLTTTSLMLVRRMVEQRVRENIAEGLNNSVQTFQNFQ